MTRLESVFPNINSALLSASTFKQREASAAACKFAVARSMLDHPLIINVVGQLQSGYIPQLGEKAQLDDLVTQLDDRYFDLQEAADRGLVPADKYLEAFYKARAASAVSFAISNVPDAPAESIYEAAMAAGDSKLDLLLVVKAALK